MYIVDHVHERHIQDWLTVWNAKMRCIARHHVLIVHNNIVFATVWTSGRSMSASMLQAGLNIDIVCSRWSTGPEQQWQRPAVLCMIPLLYGASHLIEGLPWGTPSPAPSASHCPWHHSIAQCCHDSAWAGTQLPCKQCACMRSNVCMPCVWMISKAQTQMLEFGYLCAV